MTKMLQALFCKKKLSQALFCKKLLQALFCKAEGDGGKQRGEGTIWGQCHILFVSVKNAFDVLSLLLLFGEIFLTGKIWGQYHVMLDENLCPLCVFLRLEPYMMLDGISVHFYLSVNNSFDISRCCCCCLGKSSWRFFMKMLQSTRAKRYAKEIVGKKSTEVLTDFHFCTLVSGREGLREYNLNISQFFIYEEICLKAWK